MSPLDLTAFHFLRPWWLLALLAAVAMALVAARAQRSRSSWEAVIDEPLRDALIERALKEERTAAAAVHRPCARGGRRGAGRTDVATPAAADRPEDRRTGDRARPVAVDVCKRRRAFPL
jgi:hypothetical protein